MCPECSDDLQRQILKTLQNAYEHPVDVEFTTNFRKNGTYQINILKCRTLGMADIGRTVEIAKHINPKNIIMEAHGAIIGQSMATTIDRIIYVVPEVYSKMTEQNRYSVAKLIGRLAHHEKLEFSGHQYLCKIIEKRNGIISENYVYSDFFIV